MRLPLGLSWETLQCFVLYDRNKQLQNLSRQKFSDSVNFRWYFRHKNVTDEKIIFATRLQFYQLFLILAITALDILLKKRVSLISCFFFFFDLICLPFTCSYEYFQRNNLFSTNNNKIILYYTLQCICSQTVVHGI